MNVKFLYFILTALAVLAASIGCEDKEDSPTGPEPTPSSLFPIEESVFWVYDREDYENDSLTYRSPDSVIVGKKIIWGGSFWYPIWDIDTVYWRNGVDGVWRLLYDEEYPPGISEKYYAYPGSAGEKWYLPSEEDSVSLVSTTETVEVPAGVFDNCYYYRIKRSDRSRNVSVWIKPGLGKVQESLLQIVGDDTLRRAEKLKFIP